MARKWWPVVGRSTDHDLEQQHRLLNAYAGPGGPEVLLLADSAVVGSGTESLDRLLSVELDRRVLSVSGPDYGPRVLLALLEALGACAGRPQVVLVPLTVVSAQTMRLADPVRGHALLAAQLRAASGSPRGHRPARPTAADQDAWDRLAGPSLLGARRTCGEVRLLEEVRPATPCQAEVRRRAVLDHQHAGRLDGTGLAVVAQLSATAAALPGQVLAYVPPVDHEGAVALLGAGFDERFRANTTDLIATWAGTPVVDASRSSPAGEFGPDERLLPAGRARLAGLLAAALREERA